MTVKELKEKLEILIEDGKEDYTVYVDNFDNDCYHNISIVVTDLYNEIVISSDNVE